MKIHERLIGANHPVYVIAEIGINHDGRAQQAMQLVDAAAKAGADAVKFQIITAQRCYSPSSPSYSIFKEVELTKDEWRTIFAHARRAKLDCLATFADGQDLQDYDEFPWPAYKISSSNVTNIPLLKAMAAKGRPVILSTGLSYRKEIREAVDCLKDNGARDIILLQCTSIYPAPPEAVHLNVLKTLREEFFDCLVGFSDHTQGIACAGAAVALGACLIEKHFTLDKKQKGPDHHFSADPPEFAGMVRQIRTVEAALGSPIKEPVLSEITDRPKLRRTIVALRSLKAGQILTSHDIGLKRSVAPGLLPKHFENIVGKIIKNDVLPHEPITSAMVELEDR